MLALAVSVFESASAETLCNNSLFSDPSAWGAATSGPNAWLKHGLPSPPSPVPPPAALAKTCQVYKSKNEVCCSNATVDAIETAFTVAQAAITAAEASIDNGTDFAKGIVNIISGTISAVCSQNLPPFAKICNTLTATIEKYTNRLMDDVRRIAKDQTHCASAIATYAEGMACFACEVNFADFVDLERKVIRLSSSTCDAVYSYCAQSIQNDVNELLKTVTDFTNELTSELTGGDSPIPSFKPPVIPDMCGGNFVTPGDCRKFICHSLLNGFDASQWLNWGNWVSVLNSLQEGDDTAGRRSLLDERAAEMLSEKPAKVAKALWRELSPALATSDNFNEYADDGYDAFRVGCQDLKTCPGLAWWEYALLCAGAVALVGILTLFMVRRTRKQAYDRHRDTPETGIKGPDASYGSI